MKVILINKNSFTIASLYSKKEFLPASVRSNIVYKFECQSCNALYVGSTGRHFKTRISEYLGVSGRTGNVLSSQPHSSIRAHSVDNIHPVSYNDFSVLASTNSFDLRITESIFINKLSPNLNQTYSAVPLLISKPALTVPGDDRSGIG